MIWVPPAVKAGVLESVVVVPAFQVMLSVEYSNLSKMFELPVTDARYQMGWPAAGIKELTEVFDNMNKLVDEVER